MPDAPPIFRGSWQPKPKTRKQILRDHDKQRGNSSARGYDARWQRVRRAKLACSPVCEMCEATGRTSAAEMVHHVTPLSDGGDRLADSNLQSLCNACHDQIHKQMRPSRSVF